MASNNIFNSNTVSQSGRGQTVVLTLEQLEQSTRHPTLRLTLRQKANQLHNGNANLNLNSSNHISVKDRLGKLMKKAREETAGLLSEEKQKVNQLDTNSRFLGRKEDKQVDDVARRRLNSVFDGLNAEMKTLRQMSLTGMIWALGRGRRDSGRWSYEGIM